MAIPDEGSDPAEVLQAMEGFRVGDIRWKEGRAFSLAYYPGPETYALAIEAYARFSSENALNTDPFPSLKRMQADVLADTCALLGGDDETVGVFTSGGTESILTAVEGARNWGRTRGITHPELVMPTSAHAAFSKACAYFGVTSVRVPVRADYRADAEAMAAAITPDTVMLVCSAPTYPQGVIDPVPEIAGLAAEFDILCHVDACMGFTLPWLARLGLVDKPWNFEVPGVTSMSCDLHKYGYAAKGASVLAHRDRGLRKHHVFITTDWLGGLYGSPAMLGTRSGGAIASAWAVMHHLGAEGYLRLTRDAYDARVAIERGIRTTPGLAVRGTPETTLVAFGAETDLPPDEQLDIYAVGDGLLANGGWYCDRQTPPDSLHCTVNAVHAQGDITTSFVAALREQVDAVRAGGRSAGDRTRAYGTAE